MIDSIDIIMPAYNSERTIGTAIESVLNQTFKNFKLIIIDDYSNDSTYEIASHYAKNDRRIVLIKNKNNKGVSATRYEGIKRAKSDWIAFLDSDDYWRNDKLEKQVNLQDETKGKLFYTGSAFINEDGEIYSYELDVPLRLTYKELLKQNLLSNSSSLVYKNLYLNNIVIRDDIHEDYAVWLSILNGDEIAYGINEPLLIYRISSKSKSGNKIKAAKMNWRTYRCCKLGLLESIYYMFWYTVKGIMKYKNFK